jgi:ketosteroid isomerase-like protein
MSPTESVQSIYQMFGAGNISGILDLLAEDVAWEAWADNAAQHAAVPSMVARHGKRGVAEFFTVVGSMTITDFQVVNIMEGGREVAATIVIEAVVPGGGTYRDEEIHLWTFNDEGKISGLRHYIDTAKHIAAWQSASVEFVGRALLG